MKLINILFPKTYCKHRDTVVSKTTRPYSEFINEVLVERYCKKCFLQLSSIILYEGSYSGTRPPEAVKKEVLDLISGRVKYEAGMDPITDKEEMQSISDNMPVSKGHRYENYEVKY